MPAARTSRSANPSPTADKTHRMRGSGGSGDEIALKDGKHLLVVQYIWHGPFRASAMRRTKMAAIPASELRQLFFEVAKVALRCQARYYIHLSQQPTVVKAIREVVQPSRGRRRHRPFRREIGNDQSPSVYEWLFAAQPVTWACHADRQLYVAPSPVDRDSTACGKPSLPGDSRFQSASRRQNATVPAEVP